MFIPVQEQLVQFFYGTSLTHTVILNDGKTDLLRWIYWGLPDGAPMEASQAWSLVLWLRTECLGRQQPCRVCAQTPRWYKLAVWKTNRFILAYLVVFCLYYISHLIDSCFLLILFAEKCPSIHLPIHSMFSYQSFLLHELSWLAVRVLILSYLLLFQ